MNLQYTESHDADHFMTAWLEYNGTVSRKRDLQLIVVDWTEFLFLKQLIQKGSGKKCLIKTIKSFSSF